MEGEEFSGCEGGAGEDAPWKNIRTSILRGFVGVEGGGVDEADADVDADVEAAIGFEMDALPFT